MDESLEVHRSRWESATRYYVAFLQVDLLGDWVVVTVNGGKKSRMGNIRTRHVGTMEKGLKFIESIHKKRIRNGYVLV